MISAQEINTMLDTLRQGIADLEAAAEPMRETCSFEGVEYRAFVNLGNAASWMRDAVEGLETARDSLAYYEKVTSKTDS